MCSTATTVSMDGRLFLTSVHSKARLNIIRNASNEYFPLSFGSANSVKSPPFLTFLACITPHLIQLIHPTKLLSHIQGYKLYYSIHILFVKMCIQDKFQSQIPQTGVFEVVVKKCYHFTQWHWFSELKIDDPLPRQNLQKYYSKAIDVARRMDMAVYLVFWIHIAKCSSYL